MADFDKAYKLLIQVEYSGKKHKFLHKNSGENGYTIGGVYQKFYPDAIDWEFIDRVLKMCDYEIEIASELLFNDVQIQSQILNTMKVNYWDKNKLDMLDSDLIANEIFLFGVHTGAVNAAKTAQKLVGVDDDGIIGNQSIKALNRFDKNKFSELFDELEMAYYIKSARTQFLNGFKNRAYYV